MQVNAVDHSTRSIATRLLCSLTWFCARHAWFTILVSTISLIGCVYYSYEKLQFKTDRADLINPSAEFHQRWVRFTESFDKTDDIVVVVESSKPERLKQALDEIGQRLNAHPELFKNVLYRVDQANLRDKGLQFLPPDLLADGLDRLEEYRPVLEGHWELITLNGIITRLNRHLSRLKDQPNEQQSLLHHADLLLTSLAKTLKDSDEFTNPWPEILSVPETLRNQGNQSEYLLNDNGTMGFVMATAIHDGKTFEGPTAAIDMVRRQLQEAGRRYPDAKILLTGISVLENDEMRRSMTDSTTASLISFVGVAVLLFLGFRGVLHPFLGLSMLAVGMAWSFGYTTSVIGHLNILSVSFAAMLMGLGIDFAIHILSRYLELRHENQGLHEALIATTDSVGVGIVTGAVTTSLSFFCATLTDFLGVAELGIIAGGGILLCALSAFTILPAIIAVADRNTTVTALPRPFQAQWLRSMTLRFPLLVLLISLSGIGYLCAQIMDWSRPFPTYRVVYNHNLLDLQADGLESVEAQKHIFESSKHSLLYALSIANSAEEARAAKAKFEKLGSVHQVQELATRFPTQSPAETRRLIEAYRDRLSKLPETPEVPKPAMPAAIGRSLEALIKTLKGNQDALSKRLVVSIDAFLNDLDEKSLQQQIRFLGEYQYRLSFSLLGQLQAIAASADPVPMTINDLPVELRSRFISDDGKWLLQIFPKDQIWDMEPLEKFVMELRSVDPDVTGTPLQNYEAARQIKSSYEICAFYALGVILLTLLVDFAQKRHLFWIFAPSVAATVILGYMMVDHRLPLSPGLLLLTFAGISFVLSIFWDLSAVTDCLLAIMPPIVGLGMTLGILALLNIPLNAANLIILPLILGIGVDNGVHIMHDFHLKPNVVYSTSPSTTNAIMLTSTTTMVGFGSMMMSAHRGLYSLGAVLTIGVGACLFVSLVTLPALLTLISRHRGQGAASDRQGPARQDPTGLNPTGGSQDQPAAEQQVIVQEPIHIS